MYITLVSMRHFFGVKPFKKDGILKLIKEKDNNYDDEAIKVEMRHAGQVAYVSNSTNTVIRGTMSAGRIYDKILDEDYAQIKFYNRDIGTVLKWLFSFTNFNLPVFDFLLLSNGFLKMSYHVPSLNCAEHLNAFL